MLVYVHILYAEFYASPRLQYYTSWLAGNHPCPVNAYKASPPSGQMCITRTILSDSVSALNACPIPGLPGPGVRHSFDSPSPCQTRCVLGP